MPTLCRITIYPIKSLDGVEVASASVLPNGALENDRRWAILDRQGRAVNGKRTPAVHLVRATFDAPLSSVTLSGAGPTQAFCLADEAPAIAAWLSTAVQLSCRLIESRDGGFPDDDDAPGPTVIGAASLATAASWFPPVDLSEMRRRFRANLEIDASEPFWEDRLADDGARIVRFSVGEVVYRGRTICQRCVVPTRDSLTGEAVPGVAAAFARQRERSLPPWSPRGKFDHFYRLAINTSPESVPAGATLRVGDDLSIQEG